MWYGDVSRVQNTSILMYDLVGQNDTLKYSSAIHENLPTKPLVVLLSLILSNIQISKQLQYFVFEGFNRYIVKEKGKLCCSTFSGAIFFFSLNLKF